MVEEMQRIQSDDETKRKMLEILKLFHLEEEMDSMDVDGMLLFNFVYTFSLNNTCIRYYCFCSL